MKTPTSFVGGPGDLPQTFQIKSPGDGVYRVRLVGEHVANVANVSFAGAGDIQSVDLRPGAYTAWIEPLGANSGFHQSVELAPDQIVVLKDESSWGFTGRRRTAPSRPSWTPQSRSEPHSRRRFAAGVSVDSAPGVLGGWQGDVPVSTQIFSDPRSLAFSFERPEDWKQRPRWRLTLGVEGNRLWRIPLPLFRGGLQVSLAPVLSPDGPDFAVSLMPRDPATAALVGSLNQLYGGSATEVVEATVARELPGAPPVDSAIDLLSERLSDPWGAAAAGLLMARCGDIRKVEHGVRKLAASYRWLPDAAVVAAWADAATEGSQLDQEIRCFEGILEARRRGAPYFIATDALVRDMLTALSMSAASPELRADANDELSTWTRRSKLRMRSGPYLSWEESSDEFGAEADIDFPNYAPVARGLVAEEKDQVLLTLDRAPPHSKGARFTPAAERAPGLSRRVRHKDDPHKGRFGGHSSVDGYSLEAVFGRGSGGWLRITLSVRAPEESTASSVKLFLHDSFDPDEFDVPFVAGAAELATLAYGGFTVGAWIADAGVELELDLSQLPDAPRIIVEN